MHSVSFDGTELCPTKIVCVGLNYAEHIVELNSEMPTEPVIFLKPNSAISRDLCSNAQDVVHYEGEISFLIQSGKIAGVGLGLDLTKRELQSSMKGKGLPWERCKAFDKSAVFSEFVHYTGTGEDLRFELYRNSTLVQHASYALMIHTPLDLLAEISSFLTLEEGDIIMTGTPKGVGPITKGDLFKGVLFQQDQVLVEVDWVVI